ncbi:MAG: transcription-repair coupling factor [Pseudomonadota bacterium]
MPATLTDILKSLESSREALVVSGLHGGARALLLSRVARRFKGEPILVLAATAERAEELSGDCALVFHPEDARRIKIFPEFSVLPFSRLSPEPEAQADRIQALHELLHSEPLILIASVQAAMRRVPPKEFIASGSRVVRLKESVDPIELSQYLAAYGYEDVGLVEDEGSFARRGGIIDIWPPTSALPVRIELDGERIASMRLFDPATQRSKGEAREAALIPVRDFPFDGPARNRAAHLTRGRFDEAGLPARERRAIAEAIREGIAFSGIETFMPLFHDKTATLFDYLPESSIAVIDEETDALSSAATHRRDVAELAGQTSSPERVIRPQEIILDPQALFESISRFRGMRWGALVPGETKAPRLTADVVGNADIRPLIAGHKEGEDMLTPLAELIRQWQEQDWKVALTCHTELQAARLADIFRPHGIEIAPLDGAFETIFEMSSGAVRLKLGRLSSGFRWADEGIAVLTDEEIFGGKVTRRAPAAKPMEPFTSFTEIAEGDLIVHEQHGVGRYLGLKHLTIDTKPGDYLLLEYLGGDKLYLPVYRLNLVGRYIGSSDAPAFLDKLGGTRWREAQKKVDAAVRLMARELLDIYAAREIFPGFPFPVEQSPYEEFCAAFPYDETPDQARSIDDVMRDMGTERPMDRLICGDVGYGKTEVAMRAAFRAAMAGRQAAVLVPTTVLALQHYESFTKRFSGTPVSIEMLSRFRSPKDIKAVVESMRLGKVDIVIGTHRLLQKDIHFRNLGLLIIDEEHRFGVRHKERIKKLKETVDVIALTATPIPRTLNLSLSGIRDISIINTPPADRHSIATYVAPFDDGIIRGAILKEIARSGQVFFVHNRVETIRSMEDRLRRLVPEAGIVVGHGQLEGHELERVMVEFLERRADVLLCTTIIESGLDIPNANTIIINRADTFGLAQLYQLRGRVGRSSVRACAYLLTPADGEMTPIAKKRLTVLKRFTELGSGFQIAMHDLEFRGAGNILGGAQSGHIAAVGYEMYAKLLDRAVRRLKGTRVEEEIDPELSLKVAAFLPEGYVPDPGTRIDLYRRLANRETEEEIADLAQELVDRFGELPPEAVSLLSVMEVKIMARILKIRQIAFDGASFSCQLDSSTPLDPQKILALSEGQMPKMRLFPPDRLLLPADGAKEDAAVLSAAKNSLRRLVACVSKTA